MHLPSSFDTPRFGNHYSLSLVIRTGYLLNFLFGVPLSTVVSFPKCTFGWGQALNPKPMLE